MMPQSFLRLTPETTKSREENKTDYSNTSSSFQSNIAKEIGATLEAIIIQLRNKIKVADESTHPRV